MSSREFVERQVDPDGTTLELYRNGEDYEILVNGKRIEGSAVRRSERSLVELALAPLRDRDDVTVLLAGLGIGFGLRALLDSAIVKRVDVVESSPAILAWEARYFAALNGDVRKDPRVHTHQADFGAFLKQVRLGQVIDPSLANGWLALFLDVDVSSSELTRDLNQSFYSAQGLESFESVLRPGGVFALRSAKREVDLLRLLNGRFQNLAEVAVPIESEGQMLLDYVYRARRAPLPSAGKQN